jgi:hypothetical protein
VPLKAPRSDALLGRIKSLIRAIENNDEEQIREAVLRLSRSRRYLAPLGLAIGAFVLLYDALRLLVSNWRLFLIQIPPAMWTWLAMFDLKVHVLHGRQFNVIRGPVLIPICLVIIGLTAGAFFMNAVFAFAISGDTAPKIRPGYEEARRHLRPILTSGCIVGAALAFSTVIVTRWGHPWFAISLGIVVGVMMLAYVALPARLIGVKPKQPRGDKVWTTLVSGALSFTVCTPPYALGRLGILMLGSSWLLVPGIILLALGITLQAGAVGAVRAIKLSATLSTGQQPGETPAEATAAGPMHSGG